MPRANPPPSATPSVNLRCGKTAWRPKSPNSLDCRNSLENARTVRTNRLTFTADLTSIGLPHNQRRCSLQEDRSPPRPSSANHDRLRLQRQVPFQSPRCEFHRTFTPSSNTSNIVRLLFSFPHALHWAPSPHAVFVALSIHYPRTTLYNPAHGFTLPVTLGPDPSHSLREGLCPRSGPEPALLPRPAWLPPFRR